MTFHTTKILTTLATGVSLALLGLQPACAQTPAAQQPAAPTPWLLASTGAVAPEPAAVSAALPNAPSTMLAAEPASAEPTAAESTAAEPTAPEATAPEATAAEEASSSTPVVKASFEPPFAAQTMQVGTMAPKYTEFVPAGEVGRPLGAHGKLVAGARDLYSFANFGAMFFSAGYEQLENGAPNYGTDKGAFGQRLGAAAIRESSETVFSEIVFADVFHEDPRYYQLGDKYGFLHRAFYAASRVFVTRTDSGNSTVNAALLVGYAASTALDNAYYPQINRNFKDNATGYGGSLGGAMIGALFSEFKPDVLEMFHHHS
jgi:hypothetical protein